MARAMRQLVPLFALLSAAGCFGSHGGEPVDPGPADSGRADSGPTDTGTTSPIDSGVPFDSGPDAAPDSSMPPGCFTPADPVPFTRSCFALGSSAPLPSGRPFELPIALDDGCFCGEIFHCGVDVHRGAGLGPTVIELQTGVCGGDLLCDGCFPHLDGSCSIPALPEGDYLVRVNGRDGFQLHLPTPDAGLGALDCRTPMPPADSSLVCSSESNPIASPVELCAPSAMRADVSGTITVVEGCGSCFDGAADCDVVQVGRRLLISASTRRCDCPTCGACADICQRVEVSCRLPPLTPGVYELGTADGSLNTTLEVRADGSLDPTAWPTICTARTGAAEL